MNTAMTRSEYLAWRETQKHRIELHQATHGHPITPAQRRRKKAT